MGVDAQDYAQWKRYTRTIKASREYAKLKIEFFTLNMTAWFDDVEVRKVSTPNIYMTTYSILENGSFEFPNDNSLVPMGWNVDASDPDAVKERAYIAGTDDSAEEDTAEEDTAASSFTGIRMMKFGKTNMPIWVRSLVKEPLRDEKTYIAYAAFMTENISQQDEGAVISILVLGPNGDPLYDEENNQIKITSKALKGTSGGYVTLFASITLKDAQRLHDSAAMIQIEAGLAGATQGSVYLDTAYLISQNANQHNIYDDAGNYLIAATDTLYRKTSFTNDLRGNVTQITEPKGNVYKQEYDLLDQLTAAEEPVRANVSSLRTEYQYNGNGQLTQVTNKNKQTGATLNTSRMSYNELDLMKTKTDPLGKVTSYEYDKNGNLTKVGHPNSKSILYSQYDGADRLRQMAFVGSSDVWEYEYDENGNLKTSIKNSSEKAEYFYNELNLLREVRFPLVGGNASNTKYSYNGNGQMIRKTHSVLPATTTYPIEYEYEINGLSVTVYDPYGRPTAYRNDEQSRRLKTYTETRSRNFIRYVDYDDAGQITHIYMVYETVPPVAWTRQIMMSLWYEYDENGNIIEERNGMDGTYIVYVYDELDQLMVEEYRGSRPTPGVPGSLLKKVEYLYEGDPGRLHNRTKMVTTQGSTVTTDTFAYDTTFTHLTKVNTQSYTYDNNGNMTSGAWTYDYNPLDQLISVRTTPTGSPFMYCAYNDKGLRARKTVSGVQENYFYDGDKLVYITDNINKLKYYFTRNADGELINMIDYTSSNPTTYWYLLDVRGSVISMLDVNGNRVVAYTYDAFGRITSSTGTVTLGNGKLLRDENPFRYASYYYDKDLSFYYLNARYYNPAWGRFITRDAIDDGINRYVYCQNNPVMNSDPSGMYYISFKTMGKILLLLGINPVAATLIGIGVYKLTTLITAKMALVGAKIGATLGPVGSFAFAVILGAMGYSVGKQLAVAIIDAVLQKKGGIDISFKYIWQGWPYGIKITAR